MEFKDKQKEFIKLILEKCKEDKAVNLCQIAYEILGYRITIVKSRNITETRHGHGYKTEYYNYCIKSDDPKYLLDLCSFLMDITDLIKYLIDEKYISLIGDLSYSKPDVICEAKEKNPKETRTIYGIKSYYNILESYFKNAYSYNENLVQLERNNYCSDDVYNMREQTKEN